jgi:hypothetical protein
MADLRPDELLTQSPAAPALTTAVIETKSLHGSDFDPETLLTRSDAAAALTAAGFPTATSTLATKACRGGGPIYRTYSGRALYRWRDLLTWAQSRTSAPRRSTSEADANQDAA